MDDGNVWDGLDALRARLDAAVTVGDVVEAVRSAARQAVFADGISVIVREGPLCHYVAEDSLTPLWRGRRFPMADCISGWSMLAGEAAVIPDIEADPRVPWQAYAHTSMRSLVMTPIGRPVPRAALGAYWCALVDFAPWMVARLGVIAALAGDALARVEPAVLRECA